MKADEMFWRKFDLCMVSKPADASAEPETPHVRLKWTLEAIRKEASKYSSRGEFAKGSSNAYKRACQTDVLDEVCGHMVDLRKCRNNFKRQMRSIDKVNRLSGEHYERVIR